MLVLTKGSEVFLVLFQHVGERPRFAEERPDAVVDDEVADVVGRDLLDVAHVRLHRVRVRCPVAPKMKLRLKKLLTFKL